MVVYILEQYVFLLWTVFCYSYFMCVGLVTLKITFCGKQLLYGCFSFRQIHI